MVVQARAEATRQTIIDAAVELFGEVGYGNTGLNDIFARAQVTKGAFYYHFPTKQSVAEAIFEQADARFQEALADLVSSSPPALEYLVRLTFIVADVTEHDNLVRVGNLLRQGLVQVSPAAVATFDSRRRDILVSLVKKAVAEGDLLDDIDPDAVAHTIATGLLGTRLLSDATGEDMFARLTQVWDVILRGIAPPESAPTNRLCVIRAAEQCRLNLPRFAAPPVRSTAES